MAQTSMKVLECLFSLTLGLENEYLVFTFIVDLYGIVLGWVIKDHHGPHVCESCLKQIHIIWTFYPRWNKYLLRKRKG